MRSRPSLAESAASGFCVLSTDPAQQAQLKEMLDVTGRAYFAQEAAEKQKNGDSNSLGYANNLGYVKVEGVREYIKVPFPLAVFCPPGALPASSGSHSRSQDCVSFSLSLPS